MDERLKKFLKKSITKTITNAEGDTLTVEIEGLSAKDMDLFLLLGDEADPQAKRKAMWSVFEKVMLKNFPGMTQEELDNVGLQVVNEVVSGVMEATSSKQKLNPDEFK